MYIMVYFFIYEYYCYMISCLYYDNMLIERGKKVYMRFGDLYEFLKNMNDNCYLSKYLL